MFYNLLLFFNAIALTSLASTIAACAIEIIKTIFFDDGGEHEA